MAKVKDEFTVQVDETATMLAARQAVNDSGWNVTDAGDRHLEVKVGAGLSRWPSTVRITVQGADSGASVVTMAGSIWGYGPVQKKHLKGQIGRLRNALELAVEARSGA